MKKSNSMSSHTKTKLPDRHQLRLSRTGWIRLRALASVGMILGLGAAGTLAQWSTTVSAQTGMFSSGSVQLKVNGNNPTYAFTALGVTNLPQGGSDAGMLTVANTGLVNFTYIAGATTADSGTFTGNGSTAQYPGLKNNSGTVLPNSVTASSYGALASNTTLSTYAGGSTSGSGTAITCTGGTLIQQQVLSGSGSVNTITTARALAAGASESLCVQVKVSATAPVNARMASMTVALKFTGTSS